MTTADVPADASGHGAWPTSPLERTEIEAASVVLGRAFAENPVARAALSHCSVEARLARVIRLHRGLVRAALSEGQIEVVRDAGRIVAASLSYPHDAPRGSLKAFAWTAAGALGVGPRGTYRYWIYDKHVAPLHVHVPHQYLFVLGVDPDFQGRGIGAALLRQLCARADAAGTAAYLETDKPSSVRFYERHGFVVKDDITIAALGDLRTWTMLRPRAEQP